MALNRVSQVDDRVFIRNALISVSDKAGLDELVISLLKNCPNIQIFSTGGTYSALEKLLGPDASKVLRSVSEYTGQPEMQGGLVKTLDYKIYLGLLSETYNESHRQDIQRLEGIDFDLVVVNLYPFEKTVSQPKISLEDARTNIDIGGPCMLRASAKNFLRVVSLCQPSEYAKFSQLLKDGNGAIGLSDRLNFAKASFKHTASYDYHISQFLDDKNESDMSIYQFAGGSH